MRKSYKRFADLPAGSLFLVNPEDPKETRPWLMEKTSQQYAQRLDNDTFDLLGGEWKFIPTDVVTYLHSEWAAPIPSLPR